MNHIIPHLRSWIIPEDEAALSRALSEKAVCHWQYAEKLSNMLCSYSCFSNCHLYASGTLALRASLQYLRIPPGSGVGIPSFTCEGVLFSVITAGYNPYVIDCDKNGLMNAELAMAACNQRKVRAFIAVHQFGLINRELESLADCVPVIEDCSHVPPKRYLHGSKAICGSLEGTKLIGAGEGGYFLFNGPDDNDGIEMIANRKLGGRLSDLMSVLAICQMVRLDINLERRTAIAKRYEQTTSLKVLTDDSRAAWFRFIIEFDSNTSVQQFIDDAALSGITFRRPIMPSPLHHYITDFKEQCPNAEKLWKTTVSIPIYPDLTDLEVDQVTKFLQKYLI